MSKSIVLKSPARKAASLAAILALAVLSQPADATPANGGNTVQSFYDTLLTTMKNGRTLGQSGRFAQLEPVIRTTFDIQSMARLSVGPSWATLTEAQRQQVTDSFGRYISAIYADRFDSYAGTEAAEPASRPPLPASWCAVRSLTTADEPTIPCGLWRDPLGHTPTCPRSAIHGP
jgi:phospholipid transport system substrate-binding protein